ncbi:hypothetical protein [Desulfuromonas thiophila]|uniref:hypothetical protein n=1 Tax=Desulfuromonas thiophila TaxID=57664 RepID=UPI0024A9B2F4|nr:hypothetical protein [Desulfuromonas thiophila]
MTLKRITNLGLVILLLLCGGCGLKEGIVQKEPTSYLWFTGDTNDATVYIDDLAPIKLESQSSTATTESENTNRTNQIHYELSPGKHSIVVKKSGEEVVNRNVLLGNGITKEIQIP